MCSEARVCAMAVAGDGAAVLSSGAREGSVAGSGEDVSPLAGSGAGR